MTREEFTNFLKSIGGLKSCYKQNYVIDSAGSFSFGEGWYDITKKMIEDIIALGWDKNLCQAKEKFGGGRFYIGSATEEVWKRISEWEDETYKTCEQCGTKENVTTNDSGWMLTLCNTCRNKAKI